MDHQTAIGTHDTNVPKGAPERPLVTFALFAYNQEKFIREAVEGAFSQTYSPLEIILSDDCSSDRTFEIMEEMAREYRGPHRVVVRQSPKNRRLMGHINDVVALAEGSIIVMAAGDDISLPERTTEHAEIYTRWPVTHAVCSDYFTMSTPFVPVSNQSEKALRQFTLLRHISNVGGWGTGATYSYRRECFEWPSLVPEIIENEDRVLPTRAAILGRVAYQKAKLIRYRTPEEVGQLEAKRRWWKKEIINERADHLNATLLIATKSKRLSPFSGLSSRLLLRLACWNAVISNSPELNLSHSRRAIISGALATPFIFWLKLQRLTDFYAPIIRRLHCEE
ncbi:glycosyltransferase family 2 protein [Cereibacter sphaeroides]|uniref:glycosyltransferase family 2 protein n=1 Tax=Cereibacter sphaeroides TaxID=1063 RepID=UPI001F1C93DA|nr:glycosyltransferase family A protein [Cereibacter sphaeroides]MCE6967486.1 glycosyltransferase family 2 protein [Cereibacter sphaeroides]